MFTVRTCCFYEWCVNNGNTRAFMSVGFEYEEANMQLFMHFVSCCLSRVWKREKYKALILK